MPEKFGGGWEIFLKKRTFGLGEPPPRPKVRFFKKISHPPPNFSGILGTPKGVQNAPEHHHTTLIYT